MMKSITLAILLSFTLCSGFGFAQQPQAQPDGIPVKPLSRLRVLQSEQEINRQSQMEYAQMMQQAQQKGVLVPVTDPQMVRLRAIAKRLIPYAPRWNERARQWRWQVNLLDSEQVNAFCMPGGRIAFFTGILTTLKLTDDEAAVVMGHEIAHALREHGRERAAKSGITSMVGRIAGAGLSAWLGIDPRITGTVTDQAAQLVVLRFSREEETEADLVGLDMAARAGFDPRAGIALWQKMAALNKRAPPAWLSTHPSGSNRITEIDKNMGLLLPLYARSKGVDVGALPAYRSTPLAAR